MAIVQQHRSDLVKRSRLNAAPVAQWDSASVFQADDQRATLSDRLR
jgi:hypothetical protein